MIRKSTAGVIGGAVGLILSAVIILPGIPASESTVVRVVDGDTIVVATKSGEEKVRIIGIDTPELRQHECYSQEAARFANRLLNRKTVKLRSDPGVPDRDKYGRLLRYVKVGNADFGRQAIDTGMAVEMTVSGQTYAKRIEYRTATLEAQKAETGRWGACK